MTLMTRGNQTRHQLPADRSRRTCHKLPHHRPLDRRIIYTPYDKTAAPEVTPPSTRHGKRLLASTPLVSSEAAHKLAEGDQPLDRRRLGGVQVAVEKQDGNGSQQNYLVSAT